MVVRKKRKEKKLKKKEMFYLTMHSTHFIYGYVVVGHMVKDHSDCERGNSLPPHGLPQSLLNQSWSTGWNKK